MATHIHTLVLDGVPRLGAENADRARRFITLVDALYEHRCKLVASAEAPPDRLHERGENAAMFERTASRLVRTMLVALQPHAGVWLAAAGDAERVGALDFFADTATRARGWGAPLPIWPG